MSVPLAGMVMGSLGESPSWSNEAALEARGLADTLMADTRFLVYLEQNFNILENILLYFLAELA